jgi:hypothetical protein
MPDLMIVAQWATIASCAVSVLTAVLNASQAVKRNAEDDEAGDVSDA